VVEISIYSDEARRVINGVVDDALAARPSLSPNQRRGRPVLQGGNSPEKLVAEITRVINGSSGQPKYDARGLRRPGVTVTNQTPFFRDTDSSVFINPSLVGDECELFKDTEGVWRLGVAHEFKATADCQAVAGSRNNMAGTGKKEAPGRGGAAPPPRAPPVTIITRSFIAQPFPVVRSFRAACAI